MYQLFRRSKARHHRMYGFRKCSVAERRAQGKASSLVGMFPRIEPRKRRVLALPRTPKTGVVDHSFLSERHGSANAHGTAQERTGMNGCSLSAFPPPLRWAPSRSQPPFLSSSPTEETQKPLD